jgi:hypothetical protein
MSIYRFDENMRPDADYEPGRLEHLAAGNEGRLLDPRRTPIRILSLDMTVGMFTLRIEGFEDEGTLWDVPFEEIRHYQFLEGCRTAPGPAVEEMEERIRGFDRPLTIACREEDRERTLARIRVLRREIDDWIGSESEVFRSGMGLPDPESRLGEPLLWRDLERFLEERGLRDIEEAFAERFVANPESGELVKGHRIVIAELGLLPYEGKIVRSAGLFDGAWSKERRAEHVLHRAAFVQATFARLGLENVLLFRGLSCEGPIRPASNRTFVSATFDRKVAESHFEAGGSGASRVLHGQAVPIERLFMTFYETEAMNRRYREAEAVLFHDAGGGLF